MRFVLVGFMNTANYYILYLIFIHLASLPYLISHLSAFLISMIGSFYLNSYFTYKVKPTLKKFLQYPLTYVVNISVSTLALILLVDILGLNENISPLIAQGITIPATFFVSKKVLTNDNAKGEANE
ncbi:GtrA family protein [Planococcus glaciei]|uniref:GtrA family protein n=1 Tax=Planococcus glaciei TaxID=459472 RepID=UPI001F3182BF|nr:GtrA family protein [Planococcus glaciei]